MPAVSKKQFRFMAAIEHGGIKKKGFAPSKAREFVQGVNDKSLPTQKGKKGNLGKMKMQNGGRNYDPYDKKKAVKTGAHYGRKASSSSNLQKYG